jgi:lipid-A-disaccharide synthase
MSGRQIKVAVIAGEESGDILGADLIAELKRRDGVGLVLAGVGGVHLEAQGLQSLFDPGEIALMGLTAIVRRLPRLLGLIRRTARALIAFKPDVLVIIDAPEFTHRVAQRMKALGLALAACRRDDGLCG